MVMSLFKIKVFFEFVLMSSICTFVFVLIVSDHFCLIFQEPESHTQFQQRLYVRATYDWCMFASVHLVMLVNHYGHTHRLHTNGSGIRSQSQMLNKDKTGAWYQSTYPLMILDHPD